MTGRTLPRRAEAVAVPPPGIGPADLAGLVGSRLCHDLISPLGAIGNGLELLSLTGGGGGSGGTELALVSDSVASATARLRFCRIAYGGGAQDGAMARREIVAILADLVRGSRLRVDWDIPEPRPRSAVKRAFLALQCLETVLPGGGRINVCHQPGARDEPGSGWSLHATGPRLRFDPAPWSWLTGPDGGTGAPPAPGPGTVQFLLLAALLAADGGAVRLDRREDAVTLRF